MFRERNPGPSTYRGEEGRSGLGREWEGREGRAGRDMRV